MTVYHSVSDDTLVCRSDYSLLSVAGRDYLLRGMCLRELLPRATLVIFSLFRGSLILCLALCCTRLFADRLPHLLFGCSFAWLLCWCPSLAVLFYSVTARSPSCSACCSAVCSTLSLCLSHKLPPLLFVIITLLSLYTFFILPQIRS